MDRPSAAENKTTFVRLFVEKSHIIDMEYPDRRMKTMGVLERMVEFGPHWGPTRVEILNLRTLLPGPPTLESLSGTKMKIVEIFKKILRVDYSEGTNAEAGSTSDNVGNVFEGTSHIVQTPDPIISLEENSLDTIQPR